MKWKVGQTVMVQSRTWANINKPGGCARITKVHTSLPYDDDDNDADDDNASVGIVEGLDVKYIVGGGAEKMLDPGIVTPYEGLERAGRSRRGREFLMKREADVVVAKENRGNAQAAKESSGNRQTHTKNHHASKSRRGSSANQPPVRAALPSRAQHPEVPSSATCSTPEPPRQGLSSKRNKKKKLPTKVTPIPKLVVVPTHRRALEAAEEISPIWMDSSSHGSGSSSHPTKPPGRSPTVARGLDFDEKDDSLPHRSSKPAAVPPRKHSSILPRQEPQPSSQKQRKPSAAHSLSQPVLSHRTKKSDQAVAKRKRPGQESTAKPSAKRKLPPSSFSRTTSAYASSAHNHSSSHSRDHTSGKPSARSQSKHPNQQPQQRKPLLDVYRREVEKAREFMDEMVSGSRTQDGDDDPRYREFLSHLYKVWIKVDGEEELSEDRFRVVFHQVTNHAFSPAELDRHLTRLCEEGNEVMRSDGMLYRIQ